MKKNFSQVFTPCGVGGFTLIEVLIAVLVLSVALGASLQAIGNYAGFQTAMAQRYHAHIVAWDAFMTCYVEKRSDPETKCEESGVAEYKERYWEWHALDQEGELVFQLREKEDPMRVPLVLRKVEVYASDGDDRELIGAMTGILTVED